MEQPRKYHAETTGSDLDQSRSRFLSELEENQLTNEIRYRYSELKRPAGQPEEVHIHFTAYFLTEEIRQKLGKAGFKIYEE
jgi:hypothetical protein